MKELGELIAKKLNKKFKFKIEKSRIRKSQTEVENLKANNTNGKSNLDYAQYLKRKCGNYKVEKSISSTSVKPICCEVRRVKPIVDIKCNYNC